MSGHSLTGNLSCGTAGPSVPQIISLIGITPLKSLFWQLSYSIVCLDSTEDETTVVSSRRSQSIFSNPSNMTNSLSQDIIATSVDSPAASPPPPGKAFDLSRFIHVPTAGPLQASSRTSQSASFVSDSEGTMNNSNAIGENSDSTRKKVKPSRTTLLGDRASNVDLTPLLKCPSCKILWTVRKSSKAKEEHITRCMKKNSLSMETVQRGIHEDLVAASLQDAPAVSTAAAKGKRKISSRQAEASSLSEINQRPKTYLGDIVNGAAPKKRTRRPVQTDKTTIKPIAEVHGSIVERAKLLLEDSYKSGSSMAVSNADSAISSDGIILDDEEAIPVFATQPFSGSKLANAFSKPGSSSPRKNALAFFEEYDTEESVKPLSKQLSSNKLLVSRSNSS